MCINYISQILSQILVDAAAGYGLPPSQSFLFLLWASRRLFCHIIIIIITIIIIIIIKGGQPPYFINPQKGMGKWRVENGCTYISKTTFMFL